MALSILDEYGKSTMAWTSPAMSSPLYIRMRRYWKPIVLAMAVVATLWTFQLRHHGGKRVVHSRQISQAKSNSVFSSNASSTHPLPHDSEAHDFWRSFSDIIAKGKPSFPEIKKSKDSTPWITFNRNKQPSQRPDILEVPQEQVEELQRLRKQMIADFGQLAPKLPFIRGTRGIVTTASNDALAILTTSLWMLRASGSQLPVEIWFENDHNWEEEPCTDIFPSLGAQCLFMGDYLPEKLDNPMHIVKFTFKTLALTFSSFEQALFLDCDSFPVMNPDSIFETEPFISRGWILWPDYWASTASRYLYQILGREVPDMKDNATVESGQMVINKASHAAPLLISNWYNTYGPKHWHPLLSQSAPGEGDKDTYLLAIQDYDLPWYQVYEEPQRVGYRCEKLEHPVGSAQSHPHDDFVISSNGLMRNTDGLDKGTIHPRILFIHANLPKMDPYIVLDWDMPALSWQDLLRCDKNQGETHRIWGPKDVTVAKYGWDIERALWDGMRWEACEHETGYDIWTVGSIFRPTEKLRHNLCELISKQWEDLFPGETWVPKVPEFGGRLERPWNGFDWPLSEGPSV